MDGVTDEIARKVRVTGDNILRKNRVTRKLHKRTCKKRGDGRIHAKSGGCGDQNDTKSWCYRETSALGFMMG